jgi:hypothetical protein
MKEIERTNPDMPFLVLGDLNENYDEFYRQSCNYVCAIMPDDPQAAVKAGFMLPETEESDAVLEIPVQDFLIVSQEKPPRTAFFPNAEGVFYSPWDIELQNGSYFYSNEWETIDHFLLSRAFFNKHGWEFDTAFVVDTEPFVNSSGVPAIYNARTGSGLSDHLPLVLVLESQ